MIFPYLIALILGGLRLFGVTDIAFQAVAHMFVAYTFTAAYYDQKQRYEFLGIGVALTILEVIAFFALK